MTKTFDWSPAPGGQSDMQFAVREAKFGDGYAQRVGDGLHSETESHSLTFTGRREVVAAISEFLREHAGWQAFRWTPPMGEPGLYICKKFSRVFRTPTTFSLTATFEQTFGV